LRFRVYHGTRRRQRLRAAPRELREPEEQRERGAGRRQVRSGTRGGQDEVREMNALHRGETRADHTLGFSV